MLSAPRKLVGSELPNTQEDLIFISIWVGLVAHIQDFRDQEGDKKVHRQTLPLAFGDTTARYMMSILSMPMGFITVYYTGLGKTAPWLSAFMHLWVSYRMLAFRDSEGDHDTYMVGMTLRTVSIANLRFRRCSTCIVY